MINLNLNPTSHKKQIRREIILRILALSAAFLVVWTLVFFVIAGQAWLILSIQNDALKERFEIEERTDTAQKTLAFEQTLKDANIFLSYTSTIRKEPYDDVVFLLEFTTSLIPEGITLRSFDLATAGGKLVLGGKARYRNDLLAFEKRLKEHPEYFAEVISPISNVLRPQDIDFSFSITLKR